MSSDGIPTRPEFAACSRALKADGFNHEQAKHIARLLAISDDGWSCDVQLSHDGDLTVIVSRLTSIRNFVAWRNLEGYHLASMNGDAFRAIGTVDNIERLIELLRQQTIRDDSSS